MDKKVNIGKKAKVTIKWNVKPSDYSREEEKNIIVKFAKKYGISESMVKVDACFIDSIGANGEEVALNTENIKNIQDPKFHQELFRKYLIENDIKDCNFEEILKIDSQINTMIDFSKYEKGKKYSINSIKWSNFLSYGKDNYYDFTNLHGLILLNGEPANKSGKSTFAYDLFHFLLFGKTKSGKATNMAQLFNNYLPEENEIKVEGNLTIDGENYIIRRTLTRPDKTKKTKQITQKVEYFRVYENGLEEALSDVDNLQGESTTKTSKIIKEAIGTEEDFDLIISANAKDLDDLISLKDTDRGRILSRWMGLSCLEDKDYKAREKWNKEISVGRYCDMYNRETLKEEITNLKEENKLKNEEISSEQGKINVLEQHISDYNMTRDTLLSSKRNVDPELCNVDLHTLKEQLDSIIVNGKKKSKQCDMLLEQIAAFGDITFSEEEYTNLRTEKEHIIEEIANIKANITSLKKQNSDLTSAEYCPTCGRKFDNVDNTDLINKNKGMINSLIEKGVERDNRKKEVTNRMDEIETLRKNLSEKNKLEIKLSALNTEIVSERNTYKDKKALMKSREEYDAAITENNKIDANIRVIEENIKTDKKIVETKNNNIFTLKSDITLNEKSILDKENKISKIEEEIQIERNWRIYLQMIGKDGISKTVLRDSLPMINGELNRLLNDVTDFEVEVTINEKNDVDFWLIRDDIRTRLSGASGLERTQASLALRVALGKMCNLSKPPFILLDEILGTVAKENYDDMKKLYDKVVAEYSYVLHICHLPELVDWHDGGMITIIKENNISRIK